MTKCGDPGCDYCGEDRLEYTAREYDRAVHDRDRFRGALEQIAAGQSALDAQLIAREALAGDGEGSTILRDQIDSLMAQVSRLSAGNSRLRAALEEALDYIELDSEYPRGLVARAREVLETSDDRTTLDDSPRPQGSGS